MASEDVKGIALTPARVSYILALIALLGFGWQAVSYAKDLEFKDQQHDAYIDADKKATEQMLEELKTLNKTVTELVFIVKGTSIRPAQ